MDLVLCFCVVVAVVVILCIVYRNYTLSCLLFLFCSCCYLYLGEHLIYARSQPFLSDIINSLTCTWPDQTLPRRKVWSTAQHIDSAIQICASHYRPDPSFRVWFGLARLGSPSEPQLAAQFAALSRSMPK